MMSFNNFLPGQNQTDALKKQYQPLFPLVVDGIFGPYAPVTTIEESIQRDFEYLLLTNPGEWPMNPDLGIGIKRYLFENYNSPELGKIQGRIQTQLNRYLPFPYVELISANFNHSNEDRDQGFTTLNITYAIRSNLIRLIEFRADTINSSSPYTVKDLASNVNVSSYLGSTSLGIRNLTNNMREI